MNQSFQGNFFFVAVSITLWETKGNMGSFAELRISQQEVIQSAKFCQSINDLAVSSVPRVV